MTDAAPLVSVIVPVYNKRELLAPSLDSIAASARACGGVEVIVVDHHSTDGSYELLDRWRDAATVARHAGGTISAVRNHVAALARVGGLYFVDSDCVVGPG